MKIARKDKRPKPARGEAFGILNPYGDLWTYDHFSNEGAAREHIRAFWKDINRSQDLSKFKVVPVRVTVSALSTPPQKKTEGE